MNAFLITLMLILVIGVTITQLALLHWTETWVWNVLHGCLLLVSSMTVFAHFFLLAAFNLRSLAHPLESRPLGCLPLQLEGHLRQSPS